MQVIKASAPGVKSGLTNEAKHDLIINVVPSQDILVSFFANATILPVLLGQISERFTQRKRDRAGSTFLFRDILKCV